jgi:hypothetical protein
MSMPRTMALTIINLLIATMSDAESALQLTCDPGS